VTGVQTCALPISRDGFVGAAAHDNRVDGRKEGLPFPGGMIRAGAGMGSWFRVGEPGEVATGFGDEAVETHRDEYAAVPGAVVPHVGSPRSERASEGSHPTRLRPRRWMRL